MKLFNKILTQLRDTINKSSFTKNLWITIGGNGINILVVLISTPFLTRLYSPDVYGQFAIYLAISQNISILSTFQIPSGFPIPKLDRDFKALLRLTLFIVITISFFIAVVFFLGGELISNLFDIRATYQSIVYFIPISVFLTGINYTLLGYNIRFKNFKRNSLSLIGSTLISKISIILFGILIHANPFGLVFGDILQKIVGNLISSTKNILRDFKAAISQIHLSEIKTILINNRNFPLFVLPSVWLVSFSNQIPILLTFGNVSSNDLGIYLLSTSIVGYTINLLERSLATVSLQKISEVFNKNVELVAVQIKRIQNNLVLISIAPIVILLLWGEEIFAIFLGNKWTDSALYAQLLIPIAISSLFTSFALPVYRLTNKDHINLIINIISVILKSCSLIFGLLFSYKISILLYSVSGFLTNSLHNIFIYKLLGSNKYKTQIIKLIFLVTVILMIIVFKFALYEF